MSTVAALGTWEGDTFVISVAATLAGTDVDDAEAHEVRGFRAAIASFQTLTPATSAAEQEKILEAFWSGLGLTSAAPIHRK